MSEKKLISLIFPVYNEAESLEKLMEKLSVILADLSQNYDFEIIFVNDGSTDDSLKVLNALVGDGHLIKIIDFSRNFGKEIALTAGFHQARGHAAISLDADLQHPLELLPEFLAKWEQGAEVVVGIRQKNSNEGLIKRWGSVLFYSIIKRIAYLNLTAGATDYRLLDRLVIDEFNRFSEQQRMCRALIDWLGFKREHIQFIAAPRVYGKPSYNFVKLVRLAFASFVSLSLFPLRLAGYLGIVITLLSGLLGFLILIGKAFNNYWAMSFSGPAQLAILLVFLVGIILISLGLMALYIATIHGEVINRPLYVVRHQRHPREGGDPPSLIADKENGFPPSRE